MGLVILLQIGFVLLLMIVFFLHTRKVPNDTVGQIDIFFLVTIFLYPGRCLMTLRQTSTVVFVGFLAFFV